MKEAEIILEKIKRIRTDKGLKQSDLAKLLNTAQSNYSKIESGESLLTIDRLFEIAKIFNMSVIELLGGVGSVDSIEMENLKKENEGLKGELNYLLFLLNNDFIEFMMSLETMPQDKRNKYFEMLKNIDKSKLNSLGGYMLLLSGFNQIEKD